MRSIPIIIALTALLTCSNEVVNGQSRRVPTAPKPQSISGFTLPKCEVIRARREIRQLSDKERNDFISALQTMKRNGDYERVANIHAKVFELIHNNPMFFPWHRKFLYDFEVALRKANPEVTLPYWDWSLDSQEPHKSVAFKWFGGNGQGENGCIDGPFKNWTMIDDTTKRRRCLKREFSNGDKIDAFVAAEVINRDIKLAKNHEELRAYIEVDPHGNVHTGIGGDLAENWSSQDPFFWMHHAMVDRMWERWQLQHPQIANDYPTIWEGKRGSVRDRFPGLTGNVEQMLDTKLLCYRYSGSPSDTIGEAVNKGATASGPAIQKRNILQRRSRIDVGWPEFEEQTGMGASDGVPANDDASISQPAEDTSIARNGVNDSPSRLSTPNIGSPTTSSTSPTKTSEKVQKLVTSHGLDGNPNEQVYTDPNFGLHQNEPNTPSRFKLRKPCPLTDKWIKMMGFNKSKVRRAEKRHADIITTINLDSNYVSPICPAQWTRTVMQSAEFTRKYVCDNYFKIPIDEVKNFSKVTFDVRKDGGSRYFNAKNFFQPGFFQTGGFGFSPKEFVPNFGFNPRRRRHRNSY